MRIAVRADASSKIGAGHIMRCLTIADAVARGGSSVRFICAVLPAHLEQLIRSRGHEVALLHRSKVRNPNGVSSSPLPLVDQQWDGDSTRQVLSDRQWDWMIVDH